MGNIEIERKYTVKYLPSNLERFPNRQIVQGYLSTNPVVRVRQDGDSYYLTYKGHGFEIREEYNLPLTKESFESLCSKADGNIISKTRYEIPYTYVSTDNISQSCIIELDLFEDSFSGLIYAEVEFDTVEKLNSFVPPDWFNEDVSSKSGFSNSSLSKMSSFDIPDFINQLNKNTPLKAYSPL